MLRTAASNFREAAARCRQTASHGTVLAPLSTISNGKKTHETERSNLNKRLQSSQFIVDDHDDHILDIDPPFKKILTANRGEIATRVMRACSELGVASAGIYSHEDRFTQHRYKADQAFMLSPNKVCCLKYNFDPGHVHTSNKPFLSINSLQLQHT